MDLKKQMSLTVCDALSNVINFVQFLLSTSAQLPKYIVQSTTALICSYCP